jgi:hypothetical protein
MNEIRTWKSRLFPEAYSLFLSSYAENRLGLYLFYPVASMTAPVYVYSLHENEEIMYLKPGIK